MFPFYSKCLKTLGEFLRLQNTNLEPTLKKIGDKETYKLQNLELKSRDQGVENNFCKPNFIPSKIRL